MMSKSRKQMNLEYLIRTLNDERQRACIGMGGLSADGDRILCRNSQEKFDRLSQWREPITERGVGACVLDDNGYRSPANGETFTILGGVIYEPRGVGSGADDVRVTGQTVKFDGEKWIEG